jgi:glutamate synthase domain-containing protein 2/glutamate synthase domain-containing protein 3
MHHSTLQKLVSLAQVIEPFGWKVDTILALAAQFDGEKQLNDLISSKPKKVKSAVDFFKKCMAEGTNYHSEFTLIKPESEYVKTPKSLKKRIDELVKVMKWSPEKAKKIAPHLDGVRGPDISMGATAEGPWNHLQDAANNLGIKTGTGEGGVTETRKGTALHPKGVQLASAMFNVDITYLTGGDVSIKVKAKGYINIEFELTIKDSEKQSSQIDSIIRLLRFFGEIRVEEHNIKGGQGAKPARGGQLPRFKITSQILEMRGLSEGDGDIHSSGNREDTYSIEDLLLLIHSLKAIVPGVDVVVKVVADYDIGYVVLGAVKAGASKIIIAGSEGGTGATPYTAQQHTGLPGHVGLALAHDMLVEYGVRDKVELIASGGIKNGWDMFMAYAIGANSCEIGTLALEALGCVLLKKCQNTRVVTKEQVKKLGLDYDTMIAQLELMGATDVKGNINPNWTEKDLSQFTGFTEKQLETFEKLIDGAVGGCTVGVNTQDPKNKKGYTGTTEKLEILYGLLAEQIDTHLKEAGLQSIPQLVGQRQFLSVKQDSKWKEVDSLIAQIKQQRDGHVSSPLEIPSKKELKVLEDFERFVSRSSKTAAFETHVHLEVKDISFGSALSSYCEINGLNNPIKIYVSGIAPQNLGVWSRGNIEFIIDGPANDHLNKGGLGTVKIKGSAGNQVAYGSRGGLTVVRDDIGMKAGIRNSGHTLIVFGDTDIYPAYFMTKGTVVVGGTLGHAPFVGMTGGQAYFRASKNPDLVTRSRPLTGTEKAELKKLLSQAATDVELQEDISDEYINDFVVHDPFSLNMTLEKDFKDGKLQSEYPITTAEHKVGLNFTRELLKKNDQDPHLIKFKGNAGNRFGVSITSNIVFELHGNALDGAGQTSQGTLIIHGNVKDYAGFHASGSITIHGNAGYGAFQYFSGPQATVTTVGEKSFIGLGKDSSVFITGAVNANHLRQDHGNVYIKRSQNADFPTDALEPENEDGYSRVIPEKLKELYPAKAKPNHEKLKIKSGWEVDEQRVVDSMILREAEPTESMGATASVEKLDGFDPKYVMNLAFKQLVAPSLSTLDKGSFDLSVTIQSQKTGKVKKIDSPVITQSQLEDLKRLHQNGINSVAISMAYGSSSDYQSRLTQIGKEVLEAISKGKYPADTIILTHKEASPNQPLLDSWIVVAYLNKILRENKKAHIQLIVESAECMTPHLIALNIDMGATAICPYVVLDGLDSREERNYITAVNNSWSAILAQNGVHIGSQAIGRHDCKSLGLEKSTREFLGISGKFSRWSMDDINERAIVNVTKSDLAEHGRSAQNTLPNGVTTLHMTAKEALKLQSVIKDIEDTVRPDESTEIAQKLTNRSGDTQSIRDAFEKAPLGTHHLVVGSGIAAIKAIEQLLQQDTNCTITVLTEWIDGAADTEIAPDHPAPKDRVRNLRQEILNDPRVHCYVGATLPKDDISFCESFTSVTYATGTTPRKFSTEQDPDSCTITGSHLSNWANLRGYSSCPIDLQKTQKVTITGSGNVALDNARLLAAPKADLDGMASKMNREKAAWIKNIGTPLQKSAVTAIDMLCQTSNPIHTNFDIDPLRELANYANIHIEGLGKIKDLQSELTRLKDKLSPKEFTQKQEKLAFFAQFLPPNTPSSDTNKVTITFKFGHKIAVIKKQENGRLQVSHATGQETVETDVVIGCMGGIPNFPFTDLEKKDIDDKGQLYGAPNVRLIGIAQTGRGKVNDTIDATQEVMDDIQAAKRDTDRSKFFVQVPNPTQFIKAKFPTALTYAQFVELEKSIEAGVIQRPVNFGDYFAEAQHRFPISDISSSSLSPTPARPSKVKAPVQPIVVTVVDPSTEQYQHITLSPSETLHTALERRGVLFKDPGTCNAGSCMGCEGEVVDIEDLSTKGKELGCQIAVKEIRQGDYNGGIFILTHSSEGDGVLALNTSPTKDSPLMVKAKEDHAIAVRKLEQAEREKAAIEADKFSACAINAFNFSIPVHVSQCLETLRESSHRGSGIYYTDSKGQVKMYNSDGVGALFSIPHALIKDELPTLPDAGNYGVVVINIHEGDISQQEEILSRLRRKIESEENVEVLGIRQVGTDNSIISNDPMYKVNLFQLIIVPKTPLSPETKSDFTETVKRIGLNREDDFRMDVFSASTQFVVYKGMLSADAFANYFTDFKDPRYTTRIVASHNRFSTTSKTESRAAHPWYLLVHNGEINSAKSFRDYLNDHAEDIEKRCNIVVDTSGKGDSGLLGYYFEVMSIYIKKLYPELNLTLKDLFFMTVRPYGKKSNLLTLAKDVLKLPIVEGPANLAAVDEDGTLITGKDNLGLRPSWKIEKAGAKGVSSEVAHNDGTMHPSKTHDVMLFKADGTEEIYSVSAKLEEMAGRLLKQAMVN